MPDTSANDNPQRQSSQTEHVLSLTDAQIHYTALAEWQTLYERDQPAAEMFHVAYLGVDALSSRPLTFVFNGGPGAASAYLHMGGLGPQRIMFDAQGKLPKPPVRLTANLESWLSFTDLVFIDPIGTGFSRGITKATGTESLPKPATQPEAKTAASEVSEPPKELPFWEVERDLNAIGEFIQRFLSRHHRWLSPIFIAGESYGGFRVARLVRKLQAEFGIGLSGAVLISPALEFSMLHGADYNLTSWVTLLPSLAAAAAHHRRAGMDTDFSDHLTAAEQFTRRTFIPLLALGDALPLAERQAAYGELASLIGLSPEMIERQGGRISSEVFARELLRHAQQIVGLYDASVVAIDPFPDRPLFEGNDPTLDGLDRLFTGAINSHLREQLGVETDLTYRLLSWDAFKAWQYDHKGEFKQGFLSAVDDLRAGMALNSHMQVLINHGVYDLVTPYFASNYLVDLMKLHPQLRGNLTLQHYQGGHMFYTWDQSRQQWFRDMQAFYAKAQSQ
jgi:carboxypeptidase C (cathepsin A)